MASSQETAVLAGGCFWGMQDLLRRYPGGNFHPCGLHRRRCSKCNLSESRDPRGSIGSSIRPSKS